jgi:CRP-like cAMP-binding protein
VVDVRWRYTAVETRNRELVIVPNSVLMKNRFYVLRTPAIGGEITWRRGVDLRVDLAAEPSEVKDALERAVADADIPHVLKDPPPSAVLMEVASGYCRYTLRYWLSDPQHDDPADSAVRMHALAALERAGFRLGMPQEQRLTVQENEGWRAASEEQENARRLQAIQRTDLFANLPLEEQQALAGHLVHAPFAQGDVMTRQGAIAHWLYLIVRGSARVYVDVPAGRIEVAELEAGSVFGEMGMLTGAPRTATVIAVTAVDCYRLDKVGFAHVLQRRPEIAREIAATVEARNEDRNARLASAGATPPVQGDILSRVLNFFSLRE